MLSKKRTEQTSQKNGMSSTSLILLCIFLAAILTYIIPAGSFAPGEAGEISLDSYSQSEASPVSLWKIPELIVKSFSSNASVIIAFFFVGGSVGILVETGAMQSLVAVLLRRIGNKPFLVLISFTCLFILISLNIATRYLVSFVPFMVALACSLGYDALTGVSMVLLGGAMSYCTSPTGLMTLTAQSYVDLQPLSGAGFRWICLICLAIPTLAYIYFYAERVRKNGNHSILARLGVNPPADTSPKIELSSRFTVRDGMSVALYVITLCCCVYLGSTNALSTSTMSALFLVAAVLLSLINRVPVNHIADHYISVSSRFIAPAAVVGLAGAIALILENGGIIDTIIYYLASNLQWAPDFLKAPLMFLTQLLINCAIVPGAGQAAITMPLLGPVATLSGFPLQSAVLAFNFGDGMGDFVLPYSSVLVSYLAIAGIPFRAWWKYIWKLFVLWILVASVLMYVSTIVWL